MTRLLIAALFALVPAFASAQCTGDAHQSAMSCAEGTAFNPETGLCETVATG